MNAPSPGSAPRLAYLTAGAGGMYCGSCLHDNTLARALQRRGVEAVLIPTYTPLRTDEQDVSIDRVFFGGINVYLHQKYPWLARLPRWAKSWLDRPGLLRLAASRGLKIDGRFLGELTCAMLDGERGRQRDEVAKLADWLQVLQPDLIVFTNMLIAGCARQLKEQLGKPIIVTLQGDDIFLDALPPKYRERALELIRQIEPAVDGFLTATRFYAEHMQQLLGLPAEKFRIAPLGLNTDDFADLQRVDLPDQGKTIGYLARLAPEKGLDRLVDAFLILKQRPATNNVRLRIAGWLGSEHRGYAEKQFRRLREAGWERDFQYDGVVDRQQKRQFLTGIDVLSVPAPYRDPKGLYVLEAAASGVPVVQPAHGAFPELIDKLRCGLLVQPDQPAMLAEGLQRLLLDEPLRLQLGAQGREAALRHFNADAMAEATWSVLQSFLPVNTGH